jgi:GLPGLI family protein
MILFVNASAFSQKQVQITYDNQTFNFSNVVSSKIKVVGTHHSCLSITEDMWKRQSVIFDQSTGDYTMEHTDEIRSSSLYKSYTENTLYYQEPNPTLLHVKEKLNGFEWQLIDSTKKVLGYDCRKAITKYRGRDYIAWFTTDLPFKAGPWKFNGLPGVILEVRSTDDFTKMTAMELKITNGEEPNNPFRNKSFISWEEFTELYKSKIKKVEEGWMAGNARLDIRSNHAYSAPRIEVIVESNRLNQHQKNLWNMKRDGLTNGKNKSE